MMMMLAKYMNIGKPSDKNKHIHRTSSAQLLLQSKIIACLIIHGLPAGKTNFPLAIQQAYICRHKNDLCRKTYSFS